MAQDASPGILVEYHSRGVLLGYRVCYVLYHSAGLYGSVKIRPGG